MFVDQLNSSYPKTSTTKMAGRKASLAPVRFKLKKKTDVEEPTPLRHFAEHRHLHGHPHEDMHRPCAPPLPSRSSRRFPPSTTSPSSSVRLRTACAAPSSLPGVCTLYAFRLDIQRGTAIVHLVCKGAKEAAAQCFSEPRLDFESQAGACQLELVNASKHLGTHAVFNASSQRAADCKAASVPLKHCVFDPLRSNIEVATATLWPERLYRAVTWSSLPASTRRRLDACLYASAPLVRSRHRFRRQALPGHHVRCFTRHLSVAASARFAGRRCLSRLITSAPDALVTLLHLGGSWNALVFQRLRWQQHVASESVLAARGDPYFKAPRADCLRYFDC